MNSTSTPAGTAARDATPALVVNGVRKVYGGEAALKGVSIEVRLGEVHGLLGENGAGKSTLVRILAGVEHQDAGTVTLFGAELPVPHSAAMAAAAGAAFIHQNLGLVGSLSVAENIAITAGYKMARGRIDWAGTRRRAVEALDRIGLDIQPNLPVAELPLASQAVVAIARALAVNARLIVLDEPTASLTAGEARALFEILGNLRAHGVACVLITHRTDEVLRMCDRVTVLRDGEVAGVAASSELSEAQLIALILGHAIERATHDSHQIHGVQRFQVDALRGPGVGPLSFSIAKGEIFGCTGLADAGHLALGDLVFGLEAPASGTQVLDDQPYRPRSPRDAIARGVAYVPSDRAAAGIAMSLSLRENLFFNPVQRPTRLILKKRERRSAAELLQRFGVRPAAPEAEISTLSGGNAQKVVLAKWLGRLPDLLVLAEPTIGVDVGARAEIYRNLREACAAGTSVLLISSDFEEIAEVCDRALVLRRGRPSRFVQADELNIPTITGAAYGQL